LEQQFDGLINDAVFRVIEKQTCRLEGYALAAFRRGENLIFSRNLLTPARNNTRRTSLQVVSVCVQRTAAERKI